MFATCSVDKNICVLRLRSNMDSEKNSSDTDVLGMMEVWLVKTLRLVPGEFLLQCNLRKIDASTLIEAIRMRSIKSRLIREGQSSHRALMIEQQECGISLVNESWCFEGTSISLRPWIGLERGERSY